MFSSPRINRRDSKPYSTGSASDDGQQQEPITREIVIACLLFSAIGVGYLFPFSALTQPVDYWHEIFPDFNLEFPLTTTYMWVNLIVLALIVFLSGEPSYTFRIVGGFSGQCLVLVFVPTLYFLHLREETNYFLLMGATSFVASITALVDSCAISFAAQYPIAVQEALQFGIGLSTLIGSVFRVFTKLAFPPDQVVASSLVYFYLGAVTIAFCIVAYYWLLSLPLSHQCLKFGIDHHTFHQQELHNEQHKQQQQQQRQQQYGSTGSPISSTDADFTSRFDAHTPLRKQIQSPKAHWRGDQIKEGHPLLSATNLNGNSRSSTHEHSSVAARTLLGGVAGGGIAAAGDIQEEEEELQEVSALLADKWIILRKIAFNESMVFLAFFCTLALWPPLVTEIKSFNCPMLQATEWWPLILLNLFAFGDCFGRLMTQYRGILTKDNIWVAVVTRLLFVPVLICSAKGIFFTHDFFSVLFVSGLGFTNGYIGTLAVVMVSECVEEHERGLAGTYTGFFLNLGLVFGATVALGVNKLVIGD